MNLSRIFDPALSAEELRGFTRTVAEIEWLMLILVLLYQVVRPLDEEASAALAMAMFFFAAFVLSFHYANFYRSESHWKITIETAMMISTSSPGTVRPTSTTPRMTTSTLPR